MAKFKISKPCFFDNRLYKAGDVVDFGEAKPPKGSTPVSSLVENAKAAVAAKATPTAAKEDASKTAADAAKEDALLKGK